MVGLNPRLINYGTMLTMTRAIAVHLYAAAMFLILESRAEFAREIKLCISCLEQVQTKNAVAGKAAEVCRRLMGASDAEVLELLELL
jgi:hypothetical protein